MQKATGIFVGRFQPFHNGHMLVVQGMVKLCARVVIVIGSSQEHGTDLNPFSAEQRRDMIQRTLQSANLIPLHDIAFVEIPDVAEDEAWAKHVLESVRTDGPVQVWTGNAHTKQCFEAQGVDVKTIKEVPGISSTLIRQQIKEGKVEWKQSVPEEIVIAVREKAVA